MQEPVAHRRLCFNRVAGLYDEVRPGYPDELIQDIVRLSGVPAEGRILEFGCGTGQATRQFARLGYPMLCLEVGDRLADIARQNLAQFPRAKVLTTAVEDWQPEVGAFDLAVSATAFHWVDPDIGYARAAEALKPAGTLALFWNFHVRPDEEPFLSIQKLYERHAPKMASIMPWEERLRQRKAEFEASGRFGPVEVREYRWESESTTEEYVRGMCTQSDHILLEPEARDKLLAGIRREIDRHGGTVHQPWVAALLLAKRQDSGGSAA